MHTSRSLFAAALAAFTCFSVPAIEAAAEELDGRAIVDRYIERQTVDSELAFIRMKVVGIGEKAKENRFVAAYRRAEDGSEAYLVRLVRPKDVEGVTVLTRKAVDGELRQFFYMPATGKARELVGEGRSAAFLGSDFTYEDLLREIPSFRDYERIEDVTLPDGEVCYRVRAQENEASDLGKAYAYRDLVISKSAFELKQTDYFDPDGNKIKTLVAFDYEKDSGDRTSTRPKRAVMTNDESGTWSSFAVIVSRIGEPLPEALFTVEGIESMTPADVDSLIFQLGMTVTAE